MLDARSLLAGAALLSLAPVSATAASLDVLFVGTGAVTAHLFVGICDRALDQSACPYGRFQRASAGQASFRFDDLPPGRYAVAAYQDVNGNGRLDREPVLLWSLPSEPYGFSNDVGRFGPPTVGGAAFELPASGATVSIRLARLPLDDEDAVQQAIERQRRSQ